MNDANQMTTRRAFLKTMGLGAVPLAAGVRPSTPWPPPPSLDEDDFWKLVRAQYPLTHERVYLNTGGLGPAPYPVLDAMQRTMLERQTLSEHGHSLIEQARAPVAAFFGVKPSEIAFTRNATEGNATVASGLALRPGDEVIFESHAHPGGAMAWMSRQKQQGIKVKIFDPVHRNTEDNLQRIDDLITHRTRVVQVSHITATLGLRFPVKAIADLARDRGIWFHIDGAQSAGMIPVDLREIGCDSYATSGHKWMGGPHGTGVLYIREDRLDDVAPTEVGAYSNDDYDLPDVFEYYPTARRFEPGTRDASRVVGLVEAIAFLEQIGMERVAAYNRKLARYLKEKLAQIDGVTVPGPRAPTWDSAITTFKTDRIPYDDLFRYLLREHNLRCRVVSERGLNALRVSTHVFNDIAECDKVVEATIEALNKA